MHQPAMFAARPVSLSVMAVLTATTVTCRSEAPRIVQPEGSLLEHEAQVEELLGQMTLAEKIGQMTQADQEFIADPADVARYFLGSVLSGGNSDPDAGNTMQAWTEMYDAFQQRARDTRLGIPLLYGADAVHGHSNVLGAVIFPHNIGLGATRNPELVREIAEITAREMRATGVNWNFAPCVCVPRDERWGRTYEGFSEDPEIVAELGAAAVRGYQGASLDGPLSVLATAKHYTADGGTEVGTGGPGGTGLDQGDTGMDEETLRRVHISPYQAAVQAGVGSIMPSYSSWNGLKMSANEYLLTDVLKNELGFQGFLISDYRAVDQLDPDYRTAIEKAINAGMDMVMVPDRFQEFIHHLTELVSEERVSMARIDDAVRRILRVKFAMGLMDPDRSHLADRSLQGSFGSAEHRAVARRAVRESIVLLANDAATLPLDRQVGRVHIAGENADDIGNQSGGWTIDWQGGTGEITTGGTTIRAGIERAVSENTTVAFSADGSGAAEADVGIVVIGETPYAEGLGDRADLSVDPVDVAAVRNMKSAGIPVVVVLVSGRPLILGDLIDLADALIVAWLPGTEGDGVADVLFGDHAPTGRLPYTWPRSNDQLPINAGDGKEPLFPLGFGLSY
jgi:beta-glucosidase